MQSVAQLEASIQMLPTHEFLALAEWISKEHVDRLRRDGFEPIELEAELLKGLEGPRHLIDENFFQSLRQGWGNKSAS